MIKPLTWSDQEVWKVVDEPWYTAEQLANKINEIIEHINGEPDIDEQILKNIKAEIEKNRRSPDPDCTACNGTGVIEDYFDDGRSFPCYCYKRKCDHPDCMICNEFDKWRKPAPPIVMEKSEKIDLTEEYKRRGLKPAGDVKEACPNCKDPDPEIKPMKDGSCGVCAGSGFITWKETAYNKEGKLVSDVKVAENGDKYRTSTADFTDAAYDPIDTRGYNIKLWTRDMRKMIKGKNISPKLKDDIRKKLNELEEI